MRSWEDLFSPPLLNLSEVPISLLAYIGDEVMSLYVKVHFAHLIKPSAIEREVRKRVSKKGQAELLERVKDLLNEEEMSVVKRAMNSKAATRHGNDPLYRRSTGLEALIGYLYIKGDVEKLEKILLLSVRNER